MAKKWNGSTKGRKFYLKVPKIRKIKINFRRKKTNKTNGARLGFVWLVS